MLDIHYTCEIEQGVMGNTYHGNIMKYYDFKNFFKIVKEQNGYGREILHDPKKSSPIMLLEGQWRDNCLHGYGRTLNESGHYYVGNY